MWEQGSCSSSSLTNIVATFAHEIHVLLVHKDLKILSSMRGRLESCSYKVTCVECAYKALSILSERKDAFDIMLVDVQLPDIDPFMLLGLAVNMDLPTILMSNKDYEDMLATRAIENGALLFLKSPIANDTLQYLWQLVMREKRRKSSKLVEKGVVSEMIYGIEKHCTLKGKRCVEEETENEFDNNTNKGASKKRLGDRMLSENDDKKVGKRKNSKKNEEFEWTDELRSKFFYAINQLSEGSCYPTKIVELMNVPGLTRYQVASYLQKCRNESRRFSALSKSQSSLPSSSRDGSKPRRRIIAFGAKPLLVGKYRASTNETVPDGSFMVNPEVETTNYTDNSTRTITRTDSHGNSSGQKQPAPVNFINFLGLKGDESDQKENL